MSLLVEQDARAAIVEPCLTEVSSGFFVMLFRRGDVIERRIFPDKWQAEVFARDWVVSSRKGG